MQRLRRIAWNGLAAMSSLLCLATCAMWVRSYFLRDEMRYNTEVNSNTYRVFVSDFCGISFEFSWTTTWALGQPLEPGFQHSTGTARAYPVPLRTARGGLGFYGIILRDGSLWHLAGVVPIGAVTALLLILPAIWAIRRKAALKDGLCVRCGYDLRATPSRCPEWGTEAVKSVKA